MNEPSEARKQVESLGWTEKEANALLGIYDAERYSMASIPMLRTCFIDPTAIVDPTAKVWQFASVLANAYLGARVSIGSGTEIGRGCVIGDDTRIGAQVFLPPNSVVGERVFIGPKVACADDRYPKIPRPGDPPYKAQPPIIEDDAVVGIGVVLLPGVRIGKGARVAAFTLVTKDVPDHMMLIGNPSRLCEISPEWR